jgi:hypothetical protein
MYRISDELVSSENLNKNDSNDKTSDNNDQSQKQIRHSYEET